MEDEDPLLNKDNESYELINKDERSKKRSNSISSSFAVNPIPLLSSTESNSLYDNDTNDINDQSIKSIGTIEGIALVIGMIIGTGIFSSDREIISMTGSVGASFIIWLIGGLLAWCGACCYAELGCAIPISGGPSAYLSYAYGPLTSFTYGFTSLTVIKPSGAALIAIIFGEYLAKFFYLVSKNELIQSDQISPWIFKLLACVGVIFVAILNMLSSRVATFSQNTFMILKFISILFVVIMGIVGIIKGIDGGALLSPSNAFVGTQVNMSSIALALYASLFAYDGWDQSNYVTGEMKNVNKTLPIVIHTSIPITIITFILANVSYFLILSADEVSKSNTIAIDLSTKVIGKVGGGLITMLVAISALGSLNVGTFTTARLITVNAYEGYLPNIFSKYNQKSKTPLNAIILQTVIILLYTITIGKFEILINFFSISIWYFHLLTALSVVILRIREPDLHRPYKTNIIIPMIFSTVTVFLLCMPIFAEPLTALIVLSFILISVPIYFICLKIKSRKSGTKYRGVYDHLPFFLKRR